MKTRSKTIFNIFSLITLLALLFGVVPALPVQAESLASPLFANGDLLLAKNIGGTGNDVSDSIAIDSSGNTYITGYFDGTVDFDPGVGISNLTPVGLEDIFISKFDSSNNFVWAKSMGGADYDGGNSISVDSSGNVYTTGYYAGTVDFDPGAGVVNLDSAGLRDIFISKLNSNGDFVWAKSMGGTNLDSGADIALDTSGNVYTIGSFFSPTADFDPNGGVFNLTGAGSYDIFVSKLDSNGSFVWAKNLGGSSADYGRSIALDSNNNVYTTGDFAGTADFDPGVGTANLTSAGIGDIFVSKLNSVGSFVWAKRMGGVNIDGGSDIALDSSGNVYTTGSFRDTADFDPGAGTANLTPAGDYDIFISKLNNAGSFIWAKGMGGTGSDEGGSISIDSSGNIYTTGGFAGTSDFDPGAGTANLISAGSHDIFVSRLNSVGSFIWAESMGGTDFDSSAEIVLDSTSSNIYMTGYFAGISDFDPGAGVSNLTSAGTNDIFISKFENDVIAPIVSSSVRANPNPTALASVDFTVTFSEAVTGVDATDFTLTTSGVAGTAVSGVSGSGSAYTVTVNTGAGTGTIRLDVVNDNSIKDVVFIPLAAGFTGGETYNVRTTTFTDVPITYWAWQYIGRLYSAGITGGCTAAPLNYCPDSTVTRAQMAVFLLKGIHGSSFNPPAVGVSTGFTDVATDYWAAAWIKQLAAEGITGGCGAGIYCPDATVTRAQMAVFLLKAKHGSSYSPSAATGVFTDVPVGYWADKWIEQLASEGITGGCGTGTYCPDADVTRAQMAVFLVKTFSLP